jgi:hypothetical protein
MRLHFNRNNNGQSGRQNSRLNGEIAMKSILSISAVCALAMMCGGCGLMKVTLNVNSGGFAGQLYDYNIGWRSSTRTTRCVNGGYFCVRRI